MELTREACYVTAASATDKRQKHRQILVVPTPGGGARLAAIGRPLTLLRPTGRQQQSKTTKSNLSSGTKSPCELLVPRGRGIRGLSRSNSNVETRHKNKNIRNNSTDPAQLLRQHQLHQMQLRENYLKMRREEESIPEWKRKEDYFAALGLVTKQALKEIQNKKSERKRRTTANPQFSNAAIEAKRITAMETAAKRARRREMAAAAEKNPPPINNSRIPIMPQQTSLRSTIRPLSSQPSITSPMVSSSSSHRQLLASANTLLDKSRHPMIHKLKSRNQFPTSRASFNSNQNSATKRPLATPSVSIYSNPSSQATYVHKNMLVWSRIILKCADCSEECDPDVDAIVFCKDCKCYFHATCSSNPEEINLTNSVPCVNCPRIIPFGGEGSSQASNDIDTSTREKAQKIDIDEDEDEDIDEEIGSYRRNKNDDENSEKQPSKAPSLSDSKSISEPTIEQKESLISQNIELSRVIHETDNKRTKLKDTLEGLKDDKEALIEQQIKLRQDIKKVKTVINLVKHWNPEKGELDQPENAQDLSCDSPLPPILQDNGDDNMDDEKNDNSNSESESSVTSGQVSSSSSDSSSDESNPGEESDSEKSDVQPESIKKTDVNKPFVKTETKPEPLPAHTNLSNAPEELRHDCKTKRLPLWASETVVYSPRDSQLWGCSACLEEHEKDKKGEKDTAKNTKPWEDRSETEAAIASIADQDDLEIDPLIQRNQDLCIQLDIIELGKMATELGLDLLK